MPRTKNVGRSREEDGVPEEQPRNMRRLNIEFTHVEGSGPRHTRSRGVDASVRRERAASRAADDDMYDYDPDHDYMEDASTSAGGEHEEAPSGVFVMQGRGGRFVASSSASTSTGRTRRSRAARDADTTWLVQEAMPGGPVDGSLIPSYAAHIASRIWVGQDREPLRCHSRIQWCKSLQEWETELSADLRERVSVTGLRHLPSIMHSHIDWPLISAFVERWQPDTNTFHLPFGEMTIMLHDVAYILGIPVDGDLVDMVSDSASLQADFQELLGLSRDELLVKPRAVWENGAVAVTTIYERCKLLDRVPDVQFMAFFVTLFGSTLFVDKSGNRLLPSCILELKKSTDDLDRYSWGSAALAFLYRQLGIASRVECKAIGGCLTLLQAWIYEYFPSFRPCQGALVVQPGEARASMWDTRAQSRDEHRLASFRARLDQMTDAEVNWRPYSLTPAQDVPRTTYMGCIQCRDIVEPYNPDRVLRQLGHVQGIPLPGFVPDEAYRPANVRSYSVTFRGQVLWKKFGPGSCCLGLHVHPPLLDEIPTCSPDYLPWFFTYSHPRLICDTAELAPPAVPERTNTDYWMGRSMHVIRRFIADTGGEVTPTVVEAQELIAAWDAMMRM